VDAAGTVAPDLTESERAPTLAELLARAPDHRLPFQQTLRIADRLCLALTDIHERGGIYPGIRPENVLLADDGSVTLDDTVPGTAVDVTRIATVSYVAPEQALGQSQGVRSDVYALGALLYELVTGHPPFLGDDPVAIISQHISTVPVAPSWHNPYVPKPLEALILRLLAKDPAQRPADADAVRRELAAISVVGGSPYHAEQRQQRAAANPLDRLAADVFVGRELELGQLRGAFDAARAGRAGVVLVSGEPGIGKTTLAEETMVYARLRGARVLWGRCYEWDGAPAYWPWAQVIRGYVQQCDPERLRAELGSGAAHIAQVVPDVREQLPDVPEPPRMEGEQARYRLFDSIATFLRNAAGRQPLLLALDDLHWADTPSLLLLQFVAREMEQAQLLIVGTYRDAEVGRQHPLATTLAELARGHRALRLGLQGLGKEDIARFISLSTGIAPDAALVDAVQRETEGNPFFVSEVVRLLVAEGRLGRAAEPASWSISIPESVRDVVGRRLGRLSATCNDTLAIASVVGREFSLPLLSRVSGLSTDVILDALEEALRARLITEEEPAQRYRFTHALVQDTLYAELSAGRRLRLHAAVGQALEQLHTADLAPYYDELAYHFGIAAPVGSAERAIAYAVRAGDRAMAQVAWESAIQHYERALHALDMQPEPSPSQRCDVLLALGVAQFRTVLDVSESPEGRQSFVQAAEIARSIGSFERLARAALGFAGINTVRTAGGLQQARLLENALALAPADDSALKARVMARLAVDYRVIPNMSDRSAALSEESLAMARRLNDPSVLAAVLVARFSAIWAPDSLDERLAVASEGCRAAETAGDVSPALWSQYFVGIASYESGDIDALDRAYEAAAEAAQRSGMPYFRWVTSLARAGVAIREGRFADVDVSQPELGGHSHALVAVYARMIMLFQLRREIGLADDLDEAIGAVIELSGESLDPFDRGRGTVARAFRTILLAEAGYLDDARSAFETLAIQDFADLPKDPYWLTTIALLSEACVMIGDLARAALLYDLLLPYAHRNASPASSCVPYGSVSHYLGLLATQLDRMVDAARHFEAALGLNERMRDRPAVARTKYRYAEMLIRRNLPGDRERAQELLSQARSAAEEIGMPRLVDHAQALATSIVTPSGAARAAGAQQHGLSARELDVLRLIVSGKSDREIAEALFISPRTVTTHVSNIFNKLKVNTRAEAAALAVRTGVV
jgi:predicted ATPase